MAAKIEDRLYLGDRKVSEDEAWFRQAGVELVLNVTDDLPCVFQWQQLKYLRVPLRDEPEEDLCSHLEGDAGDALAHADNDGTVVLVHCRAGSSRSASLVLGYLVKHRGWSLWRAYEHVRSVAMIKPNIGFAEQLVKYEESLHGCASVALDGFGNWLPLHEFREARSKQNM